MDRDVYNKKALFEKKRDWIHTRPLLTYLFTTENEIDTTFFMVRSDQAMTLGELGREKCLHSFRHLRKIYEGWRVLYINVSARVSVMRL